MKKIFYIILLPLVLAIAPGCSPKVYPAEIKDSVRVEIRERVVHDSVYFEIERQVEKVVTRDTASHLENDYAESDAIIIGGDLHHSLSSRPQRIYVPYQVTVRDTVTIEKHAETIVQEVNRLTSAQGFWMILGKIAATAICIALLGLVAYIIIRRYLHV